VYNVDSTLNEGGAIQETIDFIMRIDGHTERATFAVCNLGKKNLIVGETWLKVHNPEIDWITGEIQFSRCPRRCQARLVHAPTRQKVDDRAHHDTRDESADRLLCVMVDHRTKGDTIASVSQGLAEQAERQKSKKTFEEIMPAEYHTFRPVFDKDSFDELPPRRTWDHAIELKNDASPKVGKIYPLSPTEQQQLEIFIDENLKTGRIRPSKSPMASPFFFIKKKSGELRPVQDYRRLNEMTVKNSYPLPLISELIDKLKGARIFTKLDIRWGYNNVRIKEGDEWKAAFTTNKGLFEPLVMFFGLTNSPATFQTMMNHLFREQIAKGCVVVYMDDILIFSTTMEEHRRTVQEVLQIVRDNRLYLKVEKCEFERPEIDYLGLKVAFDKIAMDAVKVKGVADWPTPENTTDVRSFLGFTNFYRRFIRDFSDVAKPMNALLQKDAKWVWADEQAHAFERLKTAICSAPILVFPDPDRAYLVEADSSGYATGAVLSQMRDDDRWHPVAFISKGLSPAERNYNICDKEMLAIIRALEQWRHYLEGAKHPVQVLTDHKNLEYFMTSQKLNRRQARWSTYLSRFDLDLSYRPGKSNAKPDLLSRRADHRKGAEVDNDNVVLVLGVFEKITRHLFVAGGLGFGVKERLAWQTSHFSGGGDGCCKADGDRKPAREKPDGGPVDVRCKMVFAARSRQRFPDCLQSYLALHSTYRCRRRPRSQCTHTRAAAAHTMAACE